MFERFTDRSRKVMALANQEAQRLRHDYIGTEHILLGLIKEGSGVGANVLKTLGVDLAGIRVEVGKIVKSGEKEIVIGKLPQTDGAKNVIRYAIEEARSLNHNYIGTEHLLLGLLRVQDDVAAQVLTNLGLRLDGVRQKVLDLLKDHYEPIASGGNSDEIDEFVHNAIKQLSLAWDRAFAKHDATLANALREQIQGLHAILANRPTPPDRPESAKDAG